MTTAFAIAFAFSFIGSVPPGTINLTVLQLGLEKKFSVAIRFGAAAALVEYPYGWIAVKFASFILSTPAIVLNFQLITGIVMVTLGIFNLWAASRPSGFAVRFNNSGFRRGLLLGILNPMAIPYWIAMTTYCKSQGWIDLDTNAELHGYLTGIVLGALVLLTILVYLSAKIAPLFRHQGILKRVPGVVLLALGIYAFARLVADMQ
ncbi:MAG TPA: LysE family transporter [Cyclobacteriaceae bacterium]|nr:LysE family transporter [Cyclobacteriaceae bacterium]